MQGKVIPRNIGSLLAWILFLSTIFIVFVLHSSNPFAITARNCVSPRNSNINLIITNSSAKLDETLILEVVSQRNHSDSVGSSNTSSSSPSVVHTKKHCDLSKGKWVKDSRGSIYTNATCAALPGSRDCLSYGKDPSYIYWRWKPESCDLPVFDPRKFLHIVRGKKMAFAGDSIARNHLESLLCLLSQAETPKRIYKDEWDKFVTWHFPSHNFTLMVMWTEFFVVSNRTFINATLASPFDIYLDRINTNWTNVLPTLNYLIISSGNWYFRHMYLYKQGQKVGCVYCQDENLSKFGNQFAIRNALRKALEHINDCQECDGLTTILRTFTTSHFEHGSWYSGGYCNRTKPLDENELDFEGHTWAIRKIQLEEIERVRRKNHNKKKKFEVIDVTRAMMLRADGHPDLSLDRKSIGKTNDCLHWCLPGPIDMWSEALLDSLQRESIGS